MSEYGPDEIEHDQGSTALAHRPSQPLSLTSQQVKEQIDQVHALMRDCMRENVHYGTIPGTPKPCLLQPGADKLALMFHLTVSVETTERDLPNAHREYRATATVRHRDGTLLVEKYPAVCSTMEGKYRFRRGGKSQQQVIPTNRPVPPEFWNAVNAAKPLKESNPQAYEAAMNNATAIIGGRGFKAHKLPTGSWVIAQVQGGGGEDKSENQNPADCYNTCCKMAVKRAVVSAIRMATATSDIFDVDIDEDPPKAQPQAAPPQQYQQPQQQQYQQPQQHQSPAPSSGPPAQSTNGIANIIIEGGLHKAALTPAATNEQSRGTNNRGPWVRCVLTACEVDAAGQAITMSYFDDASANWTTMIQQAIREGRTINCEWAIDPKYGNQLKMVTLGEFVQTGQPQQQGGYTPPPANYGPVGDEELPWA